MKISVVREAVLDSISSTSGVEVVEGIIYLLSDDSSCLYKIKHDLTILEKIPLFEVEEKSHPEQLPKSEKADLEAMAKLTINGYTHLLLLSSGSKTPQRDRGFLVKLPTNYNKKHLVWPVPIAPLYQFLRSHDEITPKEKINIEGISFGENKVYLLNRGNKKHTRNVVLSFDKTEFIEFVQGHMEGLPFPSIHPIDLPEMEGIKTGFTGADFYDQKLWFTCAAEDSDNAIDDGKVVGSKIGTLKIEIFDNGRYTEERIKQYDRLSDVLFNGQVYKSKIESISIFEHPKEDNYTAVAVTDNDGGNSELLLLDIQL